MQRLPKGHGRPGTAWYKKHDEKKRGPYADFRQGYGDEKGSQQILFPGRDFLVDEKDASQDERQDVHQELAVSNGRAGGVHG